MGEPVTTRTCLSTQMVTNQLLKMSSNAPTTQALHHRYKKSSVQGQPPLAGMHQTPTMPECCQVLGRWPMHASCFCIATVAQKRNKVMQIMVFDFIYRCRTKRPTQPKQSSSSNSSSSSSRRFPLLRWPRWEAGQGWLKQEHFHIDGCFAMVKVVNLKNA